VVRLCSKDLAVERLGFGQPPSLVMLNRNLKRLWYGHWGMMENGRWKMAEGQDAESLRMDDCAAHQVCHMER